jgi:hypothetical protein
METTHTDVLAAFTYDADTGDLFWKAPTARNVKPGDKIACKSQSGYLVVCWQRKQYKAHRLIWFYAHGVWPQWSIDHINGDSTDNRVANLRDIPLFVNNQNRNKPARRNKTGHLGVFPRYGAYYAKLNFRGKIYVLGRFDTPELAHAAYKTAKGKIMEELI